MQKTGRTTASFITTFTAADNAMESTIVGASSGGSKRSRAPSPIAGSNKRHRSGKNKAEDHHSEAKSSPRDDQHTPPTSVDGFVWASKRQPLCDSQAYFRSHQGGTYTKHKVIQGLLLAGSVEMRDYLGKNTVITCCGGGRQQTKDGAWVRTATTKEPTTLQSWKHAQEEQQPVLIIIGKKHPKFKELHLKSLPENARYVVLGSFFVTDIWQEMVTSLPEEEVDDEGSLHKNPQTQQQNATQVSKTISQTVTKKRSKSSKSKSENTLVGDQEARVISEYPVYKLKLQRINSAETPACWKKETSSQKLQKPQISCQEHECIQCGKRSPKLFDGKTLCLNRKCEEFFRQDGEKLNAMDKSLKYSQVFLNSTTKFTGDHSRIPVAFQPPPAQDEAGWGSEKAFRMGMVCPDCGCCNSRVHWNFWDCSNCGYIYTSQPKPYPLSEVNKETQKHSNRFLRSKQPKHQIFKADQTTICIEGGFVSRSANTAVEENDSTIITYMIFNEKKQFLGSVVHERPSAAMLQLPGGSNQLFEEAQQSMEAMRLKRNPARCVNSAIETLTRHFQHNFGVIYEFGVSPDNTSFQDAPDIILKSLAQLTYFGKQAVTSSQQIFSHQQWEKLEGSTIMEPWVAPNELLTLAYMEDDSISYHDDGEDQLNGVISTLSLGSPAVMKLRMKKKKTKGRKNLDLENGEHDEDNESSEKGNTKPILEIQLRHGDVVTMCDTRLQAFTEHTVQPVGLRRFAMTSRFINTHYYNKGEPAEKLKKSGMTTDDLRRLGELPTRAAQFSFKGTQLQPHNFT